MKIVGYDLDIVREPLRRKFGFKGSFFSEKWVTMMTLITDDGLTVQAPGGLAVLWSDQAIFTDHCEAGGNLLMSAIAEFAAKLLVGQQYDATSRPDRILKDLFPAVHDYAKAVTNSDEVRKTFTLNALVSLDFCLWKLYAKAIGARTFDEMLPEQYAKMLSHHSSQIAYVPLVSYGIERKEIELMARDGVFLFKVKLGQSGTQEQMFAKDCQRVKEVFELLRTIGTERPVYYYLDANGRYEKKETLLRLLEFLDAIGMLDSVVILEEPFDGPVSIDVSDIPVVIAGDESVESSEDVVERIGAGYRAFAIKPAGKTLSASLEMIATAYSFDIPCFVADSACIPRLADLNRNVAARLRPFEKLQMNFMESNGADHYLNWTQLIQSHPFAGAAWLNPQRGTYHLDEAFYACSGGIYN